MRLRIAMIPQQVGMALLLMAVLAAGFGRTAEVQAGPDSAGRHGQGAGQLSARATFLAPGAEAPILPRGIQQSTVVMSEDFEGLFPGQGWTVFDNDGATSGEYYWSNRCTGAGGSQRSAWAVGGGAQGRQLGSCRDDYPNGADSWMAYGPMDFSQVTAAALDFSFWLNSECVGSQCSQKSDRLWVLHSTDGQNFDGPWWAGDWFDDPSAVSGWVSRTVDLGALAGEPKVWIAFVFQSDGSTHYPGGAFVDDVALRVDMGQCPPATASVRSLTTDRSCYAPGATIGAFVDVTTSQPGQRVKLEVQLAQLDVIWAWEEVTFTAPGQRVLELLVPSDLFPGTYTVRAMLSDADSECFQDMVEIEVLIDPSCGMATDVVTPTATRTPKPPPCPNAGPVDVVFVMDTSGSMDDEFQALCGQISSVVSQLQGMGISVNYRILGITELRECATQTVSGLLPGGRVDHSEDWAPAVADLSAGYGWQAGHTRLIIPMSDEGPQDGDPVNDPGDDRDAINVAIALAKANNVVVSPVLGSGHESDPSIRTLATALADATGGRVFESSDPASDLADGIADLIGAAACTPVVCCIEPVCVNSVSETVLIRGTTFLPGATVQIGGMSARDVVRVSDKEIRARPAAGLGLGTWDVTVINPPGGWSHTLPAALQVGGCVGTATPTPSWTPWPSRTPTPSATLRPPDPPSFTPMPTSDPLLPPCPNAGPVDVVFVLDTSGSMSDEYDALCGQVGEVVSRLQRMSVGLRYRILGISEPRACAKEHVAGLIPGGQVNHQEDWAPAVVDLAGGYPWQAGYTRLIIPISDEGPQDGDPVNDPGDDRDAVQAAIRAAMQHGVLVSPVLGTGHGSDVEALAQALAQGTGGRVFKTSDPAADLVDGIVQIIGAAACTPHINRVEPPCIETTGETIRILGDTFLPGVMVEIGGRPAQGVIRVSETEIACRADPALGQGVYDVKVINPPGGWNHVAPQALRIGNCGGEPPCEPTRPAVDPSCPLPNYIRNPGFEKFDLAWGQYSSGGRQLVSSDLARDGFYSARFEAQGGQPADERLWQYVNIPPDATDVSFWVDDVARARSVVGDPPPKSGLDRFRASLYDPFLGRELVRLWDFDPLTECDIDPPFYNLTSAQLSLVRGRTVALVFQLAKVSPDAWSMMVLIDNVHLTACTPSPPCRVEGDKVAQPAVVGPGGEVTVMIDLTGVEGACLSRRQPADVVLVLDRSGSMQDQGKIDAAKAAARGFVDRVDLSRDQLALVSFADSARVDQGLTQQAGLVRAAIDRQAASGNTDIIGGLEVARVELASGRRIAGNQPVVILLSDGQPTTGDPRGAAQALKGDGARVFTIGLGTDVDPNLMRELASAPADYFFAPDAAALDGIYQQIAGAIGGVPATNLRLVDRLSSYVELVPNSFTGAPAPTVSRDGRTLTWDIPRLGFETRVLTYRVRMTRVPGTWPTNDSAVVSYTNANGQPSTFSLPVPQVTVVAPPDPGTEVEPIPQIMCRDHDRDDGTVPSNRVVESWWDSPDIWVRNQPDGIEAPQNPIAGRANQVYVRVRNIGNVAVENIEVFVYDSPGGTNLRWPVDWAPAIGSATIARLEAGRTTVVAVPWVPQDEGHTCFLVRLVSLADPIQVEGWVPFENNICQRNVQIIGDPGGGSGSGTSSTGVGVGQRNRGSGYGSIRVSSNNLAAGSQVVIELGPELYDRWQGAGGTVTGGQLNPGDKSISLDVTPPGAGGGNAAVSARIERLPFEGEQTGRLKARVTLPGSGSPLASPAQDSEWPTLHIVQEVDGQVVGGNVLMPELRYPHRLYLPSLSHRAVTRALALVDLPPWLEGWRAPDVR